MPNVINCVEVGQGRRRGKWSDRYEIEYVRAFRVTTDTATMDPQTVRLLAEAFVGTGLPGQQKLPQRWDPHPADGGILVTEVEAEEQQDSFRWIFTVRYASGASIQNRQNYDPTLEAPVATFSQEDWEEALQEDAGGNAIVNSAGGYFDPPPTARRVRIVMTLVQNQASYDPDEAAQFTNTLNKLPFLGAAVGSVFLRSIQTSGPKTAKNDRVYWPVTYTFCFADKPEQWQFRPLDAGKFYLKKVNGVFVQQRFTDFAGRLMQDGLLDGSGGKLEEGDDPHFLAFDLYELEDWSALPINLNI